jgi:hypothetical protein
MVHQQMTIGFSKERGHLVRQRAQHALPLGYMTTRLCHLMCGKALPFRNAISINSEAAPRPGGVAS